MSTQTNPQPPMAPAPSPASKRSVPLRVLGEVAAVIVALLIGIGIGEAGKSTPSANSGAQPTATVTVPGADVTVTEQASAPAIPAGQTIGSWSGTGNQHTPFFNTPASGNFILYWSYSNNQNSNFALTATDSSGCGSGNTPNDIASSGSGNTECTGVSGPESFNVLATGNWTVKVVSAP